MPAWDSFPRSTVADCSMPTTTTKKRQICSGLCGSKVLDQCDSRLNRVLVYLKHTAGNLGVLTSVMVCDLQQVASKTKEIFHAVCLSGVCQQQLEVEFPCTSMQIMYMLCVVAVSGQFAEDCQKLAFNSYIKFSVFSFHLLSYSFIQYCSFCSCSVCSNNGSKAQSVGISLVLSFGCRINVSFRINLWCFALATFFTPILWFASGRRTFVAGTQLIYTNTKRAMGLRQDIGEG